MSGWGVWEEPSGARYEGEFCLGLRQGLVSIQTHLYEGLF
jgi:hypothetical protein